MMLGCLRREREVSLWEVDLGCLSFSEEEEGRGRGRGSSMDLMEEVEEVKLGVLG